MKPSLESSTDLPSVSMIMPVSSSTSTPVVVDLDRLGHQVGAAVLVVDEQLDVAAVRASRRCWPSVRPRSSPTLSRTNDWSMKLASSVQLLSRRIPNTVCRSGLLELQLVRLLRVPGRGVAPHTELLHRDVVELGDAVTLKVALPVYSGPLRWGRRPCRRRHAGRSCPAGSARA